MSLKKILALVRVLAMCASLFPASAFADNGVEPENEQITEPVDVEFATGCFMFVRTHVLFKMKGFDKRFFLYHEDTDLSLKALQHGHIVYHPDMCVTHGWHRGSAHSRKLLFLHIVSTVKYFFKWGLRW